MGATLVNLYQRITDAGIPTDSHESDLYVLDSAETRAILADYPELHWSAFRSQTDSRVWIDVPFMYLPWWKEER